MIGHFACHGTGTFLGYAKLGYLFSVSVENLTEGTGLNREPSRRTSLSAAAAAIIFSGSASILMAFLIVFGIVQSCTAANISIFLVILGVSAVSVFAGMVLGGLSYRRTKNRLALLSLLFAALYVALLFYLLQLVW